MHISMPWLGASLALAACLPSQEDMIARRDKKLASEFFQKADWLTDFDAAKTYAKEEDRLIFAYMTRSYAT